MSSYDSMVHEAAMLHAKKHEHWKKHDQLIDYYKRCPSSEEVSTKQSADYHLERTNYFSNQLSILLSRISDSYPNRNQHDRYYS